MGPASTRKGATTTNKKRKNAAVGFVALPAEARKAVMHDNECARRKETTASRVYLFICSRPRSLVFTCFSSTPAITSDARLLYLPNGLFPSAALLSLSFLMSSSVRVPLVSPSFVPAARHQGSALRRPRSVLE